MSFLNQTPTWVKMLPAGTESKLSVATLKYESQPNNNIYSKPEEQPKSSNNNNSNISNMTQLSSYPSLSLMNSLQKETETKQQQESWFYTLPETGRKFPEKSASSTTKSEVVNESGVRRKRTEDENESDNSDDEMAELLAERDAKAGPRTTSAMLKGSLRQKVIKYSEGKYPMSFAGTEGLDKDKALHFALTLDQHYRISTAVRRHEWYLNEEKFDFGNEADQIMMQQFDGLAPKTWNSYRSHWRLLKQRGFKITLPDLNRYFVIFKKEISGHSMRSWISAVKYYSIVRYNLKPEAVEDIQCKYMEKGKIRNENPFQAKRKPTGDLDVEQIKEIITKTDAPRHVCDGLVLSHAAGLRTMRVSALRHKQVRIVYEPNGEEIACFCITLPRDKADPRNSEKRFEQHFTNPYWNRYLQKLWTIAVSEYEKTPVEKRNPNGAVFVEGWKGASHNSDINKYAKELGWDENCSWTTHSGKYGAAVEAGRRAAAQGKSAQEIADLIKATTGHLTYAMVKKYSEPRQLKSIRGAAKAWLDQWVKDKADQTLPFEEFLNHGLKAKFHGQKLKSRNY